MIRLAAVLGVFFISFSAIFVRLADVEPITAAFFRALYALPILAVIYLLKGRPDPRPRRDRWTACLAGAMLGVDLIFWHHAIEHIGAGLSTVMGNTQVVFVGLTAWWLYGERPSRSAFGLIPLIFVGVVLVTGLGRGDAYGSDPAKGVMFGILTALAYTAFLMLLRAAGKTQGPSVGPLLDATFGAAAATLILGLALGNFSLAVHWPAHGWIVALALVSQVFGWLLITDALPKLPALETSVLLLLQPMMTMLWGFLIFAEILSPVQWAGVLCIVLGVGTLSMVGSVRDDSEASVG